MSIPHQPLHFGGRAVHFLMVVLIATACRDLTSGASREQPLAPDQVAGALDGHRVISRARFDVKTIAGTFRPGEPLQVEATVTGLTQTRAAEVQLLFPEVALAEYTGWKMNRSAAGFHVEPTLKETVSLAAGGTMSFRQSINVPVPGYYRALVLVTPTSPEPDPAGATDGPSAGRAEVWFVVDRDRGGVSKSFTVQALPAGWQPLIGPARPRIGPSSGPSGSVSLSRSTASPRSGADPTRAVATMSSEESVRQLVYFNEDKSAYDPIPNVDVIYHWLDVYDNTEIGNGSYLTDSQGIYPTPCTPYWNSYSDTEYYYIRGDIEIQVPYPRWAGAGEGLCGTGPDFATILQPSDVAHVYIQMNKAAAAARSLFGYGRMRVPVEIRPSRDLFWPPGCDLTVSQYGTPGTWAVYCTGTDVILIVNSGPNAAIFNNHYGTFAMAHEYGHAFHWGALGGNPAANHCGGSGHVLEGPSANRMCAFSEGFGDFFSAATMWPEIGSYYQNVVQNAPHFTSSADTDGLVWEQAVASYLYDLVDATGSAHLAGRDIANVPRDCRVDGEHVHSADEFFFCVDRQIDPTIRTLFGSGAQSLTALAAVPASWSESVRLAARAAGLHDLRKQ